MAQDDGLNTAGFSRQFGEWRYFNSALERLGGYRPAMVNVNVPRDLNVKKEMDWGRVLGESFKLAMGGLQARQEYVNKEVDSWLRSHSLEEYKQAVVTNSLPFQDDPLAMNRLKYDHGKIAFQLAERDFQNRVDRNEFVGMAPEQVDAEHFKHVRNALKELNGTFPWATESDYWFKKGFYEDSEGGRIKTLISQQKVANDWNVQEGIMQDAALVNAVAEDINSTPDQIIATLKDVTENPKFIHYSPKQRVELLKNCVASFSKRPDGGAILDALEDMEVFDGISLKDSIGYVDWEKAHIEAEKAKWMRDGDTFFQDHNTAEEAIARGDVAYFDWAINQEFSSNGNRLTDRAKWLMQGRAKAKTQADVLLRKAQSDAREALAGAAKAGNARAFVEGLRNGMVMYPYNQYDIDRKDIDDAMWQAFNRGEYTVDQIADIAKNPTGAYNPARGFFRAVGSACLATMTNQAEELLNNKAAVIEKPKQLDMVASIIANNPQDVDQIFGDMSQWEKEALVTMINAQSTGLTYQDCIKANSRYLSLSKTDQGRKELQMIDEGFDRLLNDMEGDGEISGDYYSKSYIKTKALAYYWNGMERKDAIEKARAEFNNAHYNVQGSPVPRSLFNTPNANYEDVMERFSDNIEKFIEENPKQEYAYSYNPYMKSFDIVDLNTMHLVKRYTNDDISKDYLNYVAEEAKKPTTSFANDVYNFVEKNKAGISNFAMKYLVPAGSNTASGGND